MPAFGGGVVGAFHDVIHRSRSLTPAALGGISSGRSSVLSGFLGIDLLRMTVNGVQRLYPSRFIHKRPKPTPSLKVSTLDLQLTEESRVIDEPVRHEMYNAFGILHDTFHSQEARAE